MRRAISSPASRAAIAVPVRNEEERLANCLRALSRQEPQGSVVAPIIILLNNCTDDSYRVAQHAGAAFGLDVRLIEKSLTPEFATPGWARRLAMEAALDLVPAHGVILTTDADSRPQPGWFAANMRHFAAGADAVAGVYDWDPAEPPPAVSYIRQLEARYAELSFRLIAQLDPRPHDPWPNHQWAWGASLAVTAKAYRQVGGMPPVPLAEDRAFQVSLERHDLKVRHACDVRVWTSGRLVGRAPGGLADLISAYDVDADTLCDAALEPPLQTCRRAAIRRRLREAWQSSRSDRIDIALRRAGCSADVKRDLATFGAFWQSVETSSRTLRRSRVLPRDLPRFVRTMERMIAGLARRSILVATRRADSSRFVTG